MRRTHRPLILYIFWATLAHAVAFAALVPIATRHAAGGGPIMVFLSSGWAPEAEGSFARPAVARLTNVSDASDVSASSVARESVGASLPETGSVAGVLESDIPGGRSSESEASYASRILAAIEAQKWYPSLARQKNIEGTPVLAFRIQKDGSPVDMRIETSSRSSILDAAAIETVERVTKFPPPPAEIGDRLIWRVPIHYTLQENSGN